MKLKVCGMRDPQNIKDLQEIEPDYMGFIFWAPSTRYVDQPDTPKLASSIKKTGVFVNATIDYIQSIITQHQLDAVQLHGDEMPQYCQLVQQQGVEVIKTFSVGKTFDFYQLAPYDKTCDYFLFDTKGPLPGGNGTGFDWKILETHSHTKPFFLSGGIGLDDLERIKPLLKSDLPLHAIDVNSKFEQSPGFKKIDELAKFKADLYEL